MNGASGLIFRNNYREILLIKRRDMPIWVIPGGCIEKGETPQQAAVREVFEETGFHVEILRQVGQYAYQGKAENDFTFECSIISGKKTLSNESKAIEYFDVNKLPEMTSPYTSIFIQDGLSKNEKPIFKTLEKLPLTFWVSTLKHPFALFKYLLTTFGIHWNT